MSEEVVRRCDFRLRDGRKRVVCGALVETNKSTIFAFDGDVFAIDLCDKCKLTAREQAPIAELSQYARPEWSQVGSNVRRLIRGKDGFVTTKMVREWARREGLEVGTSGMISQEIMNAYDEAHKAQA